MPDTAADVAGEPGAAPPGWGPRAAVVEICVDDVAGARDAERCGADRVELCADLAEGGITPSLGMVARTLAGVRRVGVQVLIRPRGGDFVYDSDELAVMLADIEAIRSLSRATPVGFVVNALTRAGEVDAQAVRHLVAACGDAPVTFSRAFDEVVDQAAALEVLVELGIGRVLTGGGPGPATAGEARLRALVEQAEGRVEVLAAGGIRSNNVAHVVAATGVREVHLRAPHHRDGRTRTSPGEIDAVLEALRRTEGRCTPHTMTEGA